MTQRMNNGNKNERICVRLTLNEKKLLEEKAQKAHTSLGWYLRRCIDHDIIDYLVYKQVDDLIIQIGRIGNNINQIAHNANCGYYSKTDSDHLLEDMKQVKELVALAAEKVGKRI